MNRLYIKSPEIERGAWMLHQATKVALIGNGGNLAICQHAASDIQRHTGKFCFAPDSIHLSALGGDNDWKAAFINYAGQYADLVIGIGCRTNSPLMDALKTNSCSMPTLAIVPKPVIHEHLETIVIPVDTYHEFEVNALWTIYMLMEYNGVKLPKLP
tara:strand:+ start:4614 stop:5084 length:471 start_codon:yes stop_codon:yes gene_type:complete